MTAAEPFLTDRIFETRPETFDAMCLEVFRFQYAHNPLYRQFCDHLRRQPDQIKHSEEIPFLPIRFFRDQCIKTTEFEPEVVFESSATTADTVSRHYVRSTALYEQSFTKSFTEFFGDPSGYAILALLPSYLERGNSSLVYMVQHLMKLSGQASNGFYLYDHAALAGVLERNIRENIPTILFGVTYALLDFSEEFPIDLSGIKVVETGGMKGRKAEMVREAVHDILCSRWNLETIFSEYGMTELLSQAWSAGYGQFSTPPWMRVLARAEDDPLFVYPYATSARGAANIIDLANVYSCAFTATDDLVQIHAGGGFEVRGRMDHSDMRGCSLMVV